MCVLNNGSLVWQYVFSRVLIDGLCILQVTSGPTFHFINTLSITFVIDNKATHFGIFSYGRDLLVMIAFLRVLYWLFISIVIA